MSGTTTGSVAAGAVALAVATVVVLGAVAPLAGGGSVAAQSTSLAIGTEPATGTPNGTARLNLSLTNEGEARSVGPVLRIQSLPPGFAVANQSSPNGTYRESTREWLWTRVDPGETVTATAVLSVPGNASGSYEVALAADDADNATATAAASLRVEESAGEDAEADDGGSDVSGEAGDGGSDGDSEDGGDGGDGDGGRSGGGIPLLPVVAVALVVVGIGAAGYLRYGR